MREVVRGHPTCSKIDILIWVFLDASSHLDKKNDNGGFPVYGDTIGHPTAAAQKPEQACIQELQTAEYFLIRK